MEATITMRLTSGQLFEASVAELAGKVVNNEYAGMPVNRMIHRRLLNKFCYEVTLNKPKVAGVEENVSIRF